MATSKWKPDARNMQENKNERLAGTKAIKKIESATSKKTRLIQLAGTKAIKKMGKATCEAVLHFHEKAAKPTQDKLKR